MKVRWGHRALVWRGVNAALLGCLIWNLGASVYWVTAHRIWEVGARDDIFPGCVAWAEKQVPANAAFLAMEASGAIYNYGHYPVVRYDHLDEASYARFRAEALAAECASLCLAVPDRSTGVRAPVAWRVAACWQSGAGIVVDASNATRRCPNEVMQRAVATPRRRTEGA